MRVAVLPSISILLASASMGCGGCETIQGSRTFTVSESMIESVLEPGQTREEVECEALCDAAIAADGEGEFGAIDLCTAELDVLVNPDPDGDAGSVSCDGRVRQFCE